SRVDGACGVDGVNARLRTRMGRERGHVNAITRTITMDMSCPRDKIQYKPLTEKMCPNHDQKMRSQVKGYEGAAEYRSPSTTRPDGEGQYKSSTRPMSAPSSCALAAIIHNPIRPEKAEDVLDEPHRALGELFWWGISRNRKLRM
ncbi:hypothetical protein DPMN_008737, partial [Dreissena polymorpha]